jgi:tripartite-type tricarboxylate transporter receptor subunit TctC
MWEDMMKRVVVGLIAMLALLVPAAAQDYPSKPVKILVAFPVGGLLDTVSRLVGEKLAAKLGQQFLVEARPGAGGTIATQAVARAEPDGYTLMMINDNHAINPSVFKSIPYDSLKDFAFIGLVGNAPMVLSVNAKVPARSVKEFVELAKAKPGGVTYASVGPGSASHLAGELLAGKTGVKMLHVPYKGGAPALTDLVAGHVNAMFLTAVIGMQQMKAGALAALAIAAPQRFEMLPEVVTMAEAGVPLEAAYWFGLVAPAGTPPAVIAKLEAALIEVLAMPDLRKRMTEMGAVVTPLGGKAFADYIRSEMAKWSGVITENKISFQ